MIKWCAKHPVLFSIFYFIFYGLFFVAVEKLITTPVWNVYSPLDDLIPFSKYAVIPYCLWFPWIAITVIGLWKYGPRKEYLRTCFTMYIGMTAILIFYCIVPNGVNLRPDTVEGTDIFANLIRALYATDTPMNVCPSLHVYVSVCMDIAWTRSSLLADSKYCWVKVLLHVLDISICIATMMMKQHSIIDVVAGAALAFIMDAIVTRKFKKIPDTEFAIEQ